MKEVFSSPCLADGKIYIGEGFHNDSDCKLFCIDAATGKKLWEHATTSHTESSPCVVDGKVFCGAGGDGLLCLDATREGQEVWHYNGGHIDCPPLVVGKRVYCGSGVDRDIDSPQETAIFCLDAATGQEVWRVKTNLPCWGKPFVSGGQAFFPLGNGDVVNPVAPPSTPADTRYAQYRGAVSDIPNSASAADQNAPVGSSPVGGSVVAAIVARPVTRPVTRAVASGCCSGRGTRRIRPVPVVVSGTVPVARP